MLALMTTLTTDTRPDTKPKKARRDASLSHDGKWRSFPKVPNLLQYVSTDAYFGRVKIGGKVFRESLGTDVFTTARLLLRDFIKKKQKRAARPVTGTFAEARTLYEAEVNADHTLKEGSKLYRRNSIKALLRTWPELDSLRPEKITESDCRAWAGRFAGKYEARFFNNTLSTLRHILEHAGISLDENPARKVKRLGVKLKELRLPEPKQFNEILSTVGTSGAGQAKHCADFIRFLAFSGCRLNEARQVRWQDVNFDKMEMRVHNSKSAKTSNKPEFRFVPIIPPMLELLNRLKLSNPSPESCICAVGECEKSLTRACKLLGIPRITHHDLRHLFATRCIETGVDVPTVSRWLGHSDGGGLAMKTYGQARSKMLTAFQANSNSLWGVIDPNAETVGRYRRLFGDARLQSYNGTLAGFNNDFAGNFQQLFQTFKPKAPPKRVV
jgi:integrase